MSLELRWIANLSASCLHAAESIYLGRQLADEQLAAVVSEPAKLLQQEIAAAGLPARAVWRALAGWAARFENNRELATIALRKTVGNVNDQIVVRLAGRIADLERAVLQGFPGLVDELALRSRPLHEQWEARGPGLVTAIERLLAPEFCVTSAEVVLVKPALGGGGAAHLPLNLVRFEGVLYNPVPELPEVLRLGWLLSQLNLDLPIFSESLRAERLPLVAELAMLPVALQAAEPVELARYDRATLLRAIDVWRVAVPPGIDVVDTLDTWWQTYRETRPRFDVALRALDQMLGD